MDKYVKRIKRIENDDGHEAAESDRPSLWLKNTAGIEYPSSIHDRTVVDKLYLPTGSNSGTSTDPFITEYQWSPPATPQKTCQLQSKTLMDTLQNTSKQTACLHVTRQLEFDNEKPANKIANSLEDEQEDIMDVEPNVITDNGESLHVDVVYESSLDFVYDPTVTTLNKWQQTQISGNMMAPMLTTAVNDNSFQTIIKSLLTRGFVVENHYDLWDDRGEGKDDDQNQRRGLGPATKLKGSIANVRGQFKCLSLFDGNVYGVRVATDKDSSIRLARVLAAVGEHPHIVSYYSNWSDARFHYIQMELCRENLASHCLENTADYLTVLEHVACALHYLHDFKKYAHNLVYQRNVFYIIPPNGGSNVVYKLGGFHGATRLSDNDGCAAAAATMADVTTLCTTVWRLIMDNDKGDNEDLRLLRAYLQLKGGKVNSATNADSGVTITSVYHVNALDVWRWCRHQQRQQLRQNLVAMEYGGGSHMDTTKPVVKVTSMKPVDIAAPVVNYHL